MPSLKTFALIILVITVFTGSAKSQYWEKAYPHPDGWNLFSLPYQVPDYSMDSVFPGLGGTVFSYSGGYFPTDTIEIGTGYWLKFANAGTEIVTSMGIVVDDGIEVSPGWNIVGCLSGNIPVGTISSIPAGMSTSQFYGYNGATGYYTADTLKPWGGYWVKVNQLGMLFLHVPDSSSRKVSSAINIVPISEAPPLPPGSDKPETSNLKPEIFALHQNYPNPFNPLTVIRYQLPVKSLVTLKIYDVLGREVKTLVKGIQDAGYESLEWDAGSVASGMYFYRLEAVSSSDPARMFMQVKKMLLLK